MTAIIITPYSAVAATVKRQRPSHLLTLLDPNTRVPTPESIAAERHLRVSIDDIAESIPGRVAPGAEHVRQILDFAAGWDRRAPFLVHCWAGISRSTAAAMILLNTIHGPGHEDDIARALRWRAPHAQPNRLMIHHADALLQRGGRLIAAANAMGPARIVWEGEIVELPLALDEL
jgi:predicted protein tyrosine phosphatase